MQSNIKFAMFNVLTTKGISIPEIVDMITDYDISESYFTPQFEGEERQIQRWVCKKGKHTEIKTWYRNGILRSWSTLYDNRLDGFLIEWHESGIMGKRCYYSQGGYRQDMTNTIWYENGEFATLKEPKLHRTWFPSGKLSSYLELNEKGAKHGFHIKFVDELQKYPNIRYYEDGEEILLDDIKWENGFLLCNIEPLRESFYNKLQSLFVKYL